MLWLYIVYSAVDLIIYSYVYQTFYNHVSKSIVFYFIAHFFHAYWNNINNYYQNIKNERIQWICLIFLWNKRYTVIMLYCFSIFTWTSFCGVTFLAYFYRDNQWWSHTTGSLMVSIIFPESEINLEQLLHNFFKNLYQITIAAKSLISFSFQFVLT